MRKRRRRFTSSHSSGACYIEPSEAPVGEAVRVTLWPMKLCPALWLLLAPGMAAAQTGLSAAVVLSGPLAEWKQEIEETGEGKVILARVYTDRRRNLIFLPKDAEQRPILRRYFLY